MAEGNGSKEPATSNGNGSQPADEDPPRTEEFAKFEELARKLAQVRS